MSHLDTVWTHLCQHLNVNSPSLSGYRKRQRWIRGSIRQIPGVPGVLYYIYLASLSHLDTVWTHLCQHLYVNSPSLSGYRKRQRWIRGSIKQIPGVPGVLYNVYLASLSHLGPIWTHICHYLYVNSPSLSGYRKRQRWIRGSIKQIPGVPGVLYNVYLASLSHLGPIWTHICHYLYVNSPSLSGYRKRQRLIRGSIKQIPGVPGLLYYIYIWHHCPF